MLVVLASHCLLQVDAKTRQLASLVDFSNPIPSTFQQQVSEVTVSGVGLGTVTQLSPSQLAAVVGTEFDFRMHSLLWGLASSTSLGADASLANSLHDLSFLSHSTSAQERDSEEGGGSTLSESSELIMVASRPLTDKSPLKSSELLASTPSGGSAGSKGGSGSGVARRGSVGGKVKTDPMNQPLTFKTKVKSSGYTQAPRTTMFKPKTNVSRYFVCLFI
jgi:hypothetical protein